MTKKAVRLLEHLEQQNGELLKEEQIVISFWRGFQKDNDKIWNRLPDFFNLT